MSTTAPYSIAEHQHRYAAWAASRAASVKGCRFRVDQGRAFLKAAGLTPALSSPDQLPVAGAIDGAHRAWRDAIIAAAGEAGLIFTHGVAAKLINIYLKTRFVCGGHHAHPRVAQLHPPIDAVLLRELSACDVGGFAADWKQAAASRWSKFDANQYERVIDLIRRALGDEPLWMIERYWRGNQ